MPFLEGETMDFSTYQALSTRADGETVGRHD